MQTYLFHTPHGRFARADAGTSRTHAVTAQHVAGHRTRISFHDSYEAAEAHREALSRRWFDACVAPVEPWIGAYTGPIWKPGDLTLPLSRAA